MPDQYSNKEGDSRAWGCAFPEAGKQFVRNLIGVLIAYVPIAAILALWPVAPLGGLLIVGGVLVPVGAAVITVVEVWVGGGGDHHPRDYPDHHRADAALFSDSDYGGLGEGDFGGGDGRGGDGDG